MHNPSDFSREQVARWMMEELQRVKYLYQEEAVFEIESKFGSEFVYMNDSGNQAIDKKVLAAFNTLTSDAVVWERRQRMWRLREDSDTPGRLQS